MRKAIIFALIILVVLSLNDVVVVDSTATPTCGSSGQICSSASPCCSGLTCTNSICTTSTPLPTNPSSGTTACTYKPITNCRSSTKISRAACLQVLGIAKEYTGSCSSTTVTFDYNTENLQCGDELSLRVAKYESGKWTKIEQTAISSSADGTGAASAIINSPGIYAVVANEKCVPDCTLKVYDVPDPVLLNSATHFGVCGKNLEGLRLTKTCSELNGQCCQRSCDTSSAPTKTKDCNICCPLGHCASSTQTLSTTSLDNPTIDNLVPVLFITADNTISTFSDSLCPTGYNFAGGFKYKSYQNSATGFDKSIVALTKNLQQIRITSGESWVILCTKDEYAYFENMRNDCVYKDAKKIPFSADPIWNSLPPISADQMTWSRYFIKNYVNPNGNYNGPSYTWNDIEYDKIVRCPHNSVICSHAHLYEFENIMGEESDYYNELYGCCELRDINIQSDKSEKDIGAENLFEDLYCNQKGDPGDRIITGVHGSAGPIDEVFIDKYLCSVLNYAKVGKVVELLPNQGRHVYSQTLDHEMRVYYYFPQKPNYATCGAYFHVGETEKFSKPYFCPIEQNKPCKEGYELIGSIRVGKPNDVTNIIDENRCDGIYGIDENGNMINPTPNPRGINKDLQIIDAGLVGLCVKKPETQTSIPPTGSAVAINSITGSSTKDITGKATGSTCSSSGQSCSSSSPCCSGLTCTNSICTTSATPTPSSSTPTTTLPVQFVQLRVDQGGTAALPAACPTGYSKMFIIAGEGNSTENLDFAYPTYTSNIPDPTKSIMKGAMALCVAENKPILHVCSKNGFVGPSTCAGKELCKDEKGKLECEYSTEEEGTFDYYAFVCDILGCPSPKYYGTNSIYYGKGEFSVCSAESCGLTLPSAIQPTTPPTNVPTLPTAPVISPVNETPSPEPKQNNTECIDNDQDSFYGTAELCQDGNDCNDNNKEIHPGIADICDNEIDEDCDGIAAPCNINCNGTAKDEDQDGSCSDVDCNDNNATIHPDATDVCSNDIDEDCDGKDSICPECTENSIISCFPKQEDYFYTYHTTCSKDGIFGKCTPDYEMNINPMSPRPSCTDGNNWTCPRQFGVCQGSKTTCSNNQWPDCDYNVMEGYSSAEICDDGLDNDCDGSTDEGCPCNTGDTRQCGSMAGECKQGKQTCNENKWSACDFASGYYPKPEYLLDSKDNDCDGSTDEGLLCFSKYKPGFLRSCGKSNVPPCAYGKQSCTNEIFDNLTIFSICESSIDPKTEICDDIDNDCDGSTDEGCPCEGTQTKKCGIGIGACTYGAQYCKNNTFTDCKGAATPTEEKCGNSIDDDCDGSTDEGCPCTDAGKPVDSRLCTKQLGVCLGFNQTCSNGTFLPCDYSKIPNYEAKEAKCDDLFDNDCDGKLDSLDYDCISTTNTKCTDGTAVESCSVSKPKYCSKDVQLEDKCEECGCPSDYHCSNGACEVIQITPPACDEDNVCDADQGETESNCNDCIEEIPEPAEAICGDDSCDVSAGESADTCPNDCPKESSILIYIIPIIIILIAGIVALFYFKKKKQKPKKEEQKPIFKSEIKQSEIKEVERPAVSMAVTQPNKSSISQLQEYLKRNLQQGKKIEDLKVASIKAGWSPEDIETAMRAIKPEVSRKNALSSLYSYVYTQLAKGLPEVMIRDKLRKAGWSPSDIEKTISYSKDSLKQLQERKQFLSSMQKDEEWAEKQLKSKLEEEKPVKKPSKQSKQKGKIKK